MTQHGSFPGRPRGRRARQDSDAPEWQGYDATPQDQREFPDLAPVRPREARARDGRTQGGQQAQPGQPGGHGGYQGAGGPGYPPGGGQASANGGYGGGQYGHAYPDGGYPGGGNGGPGQAPWQDQPAPQYSTEQRPAQQLQQERSPRQQVEEAEVPSWAEPDSVEAFSERWHRRGQESRDDEQRAGQRKRRRLLIAGASVVALAIGVFAYLESGGPGAANLGFGSFVTNFLPGELQQVPDPCATVPAATLNQFLPGPRKQAAPPLNSGANTQCTWTLDASPTYRVLEVQLQAYSPSGLASGDGSATFAAEDAYQSFENGYTSPGPKSGQPKAVVTDLSGMPGGSQTSAFQATQVFDRGGAVTDVANVYVRYRNVIITVIVDGLDQTSGGKKYGPVSMTDLTTAASTVANEMASQIAK